MNTVQVWRGWGLGLAVIGIPVLLWGGAGPPDRELRDAADLMEDVPVVPVVTVNAADVAELDNGLLWGAAAAAPTPKAGSKARRTPEWTLGGVFMKDDRRQLVVKFKSGKTPPALLGEGDALPDGARIVTIMRDKIRVEVPGEAGATQWLPVNRGGPTGPSAGD